MKVKQKISNILLVIAFIAVCVPGNAEAFKQIVRMAAEMYYPDSFFGQVTPCSIAVLEKTDDGQEVQVTYNWKCHGSWLPTSAMAMCGYDGGDGFCSEAIRPNQCCIPQDCI